MNGPGYFTLNEFQFGSISYAVITYCCISVIFADHSLVNSLILNTFSIRFVVLLASDRLAHSSKFLLISAGGVAQW